MNSFSFYNLVRALIKPYVGSHFGYKEKEYKVWNVEEVKNIHMANIEHGIVFNVYSKNTFLIKVGDRAVKVLECDFK